MTLMKSDSENDLFEVELEEQYIVDAENLYDGTEGLEDQHDADVVRLYEEHKEWDGSTQPLVDELDDVIGTAIADVETDQLRADTRSRKPSNVTLMLKQLNDYKQYLTSLQVAIARKGTGNSAFDLYKRLENVARKAKSSLTCMHAISDKVDATQIKMYEAIDAKYRPVLIRIECIAIRCYTHDEVSARDVAFRKAFSEVMDIIEQRMLELHTVSELSKEGKYNAFRHLMYCLAEAKDLNEYTAPAIVRKFLLDNMAQLSKHRSMVGSGATTSMKCLVEIHEILGKVERNKLYKQILAKPASTNVLMEVLNTIEQHVRKLITVRVGNYISDSVAKYEVFMQLLHCLSNRLLGPKQLLNRLPQEKQPNEDLAYSIFGEFLKRSELILVPKQHRYTHLKPLFLWGKRESESITVLKQARVPIAMIVFKKLQQEILEIASNSESNIHVVLRNVLDTFARRILELSTATGTLATEKCNTFEKMMRKLLQVKRGASYEYKVYQTVSIWLADNELQLKEHRNLHLGSGNTTSIKESRNAWRLLGDATRKKLFGDIRNGVVDKVFKNALSAIEKRMWWLPRKEGGLAAQKYNAFMELMQRLWLGKNLTKSNHDIISGFLEEKYELLDTPRHDANHKKINNKEFKTASIVMLEKVLNMLKSSHNSVYRL